ncbi:MAG: MerR family transcriptional regulator [Planctomycetota bacterium]|nr:MerR family transcriptional regulator [Planctomycetota bacterium]
MSHRLDKYRDEEFDLAALCVAAGAVLSRMELSIPDDRARLCPDKRTLRYYTSLGLLGAPLCFEGRRAIYGFRHLIQVLSIKVLQVKGYSLAKIQKTLPKATEDQLEKAVLADLGGEATQASTPQCRVLNTVELRPGLILTIDPRQYPNAQEIIDRFNQALLD